MYYLHKIITNKVINNYNYLFNLTSRNYESEVDNEVENLDVIFDDIEDGEIAKKIRCQ